MADPRHVSRRQFLQFASTLGVGALLAACAPVGAPAPSATGGESTEAAGQAAAVAEVPTLELWSMGFAPHQWMMEAAIADLADTAPGYNVDYQPQPGDYGSKWQARSGGGQRGTRHLYHARHRYFGVGDCRPTVQLPVTPSVMEVNEFKERFMPETFLQSYFNGNNYCIGVPDPPGDAGLVVNLAHLEEAGLEHLTVFESKEQMLEYGRKLTVRDGDDVLRAGLMYTGDGNNPIYWLSYILGPGRPLV